jgi:peptidase inhibitor family I36
MSSARVMLVVVAMLGVTSWSSTSAQPRWGDPDTPRAGVCFYEDEDFHGRRFCARAGEDVSEMPRGMNDRISSIRIFGRTEVEIFRDIRYRGASARFATDVRNLQREGWNDIVSSIRVSRGSSSRGGGRPPGWGPPTGMPREGACFFRDADFRGDSFCVARGVSYPSLPPGFNDQITAIRVSGAVVMVFSDEEYRGRSRRLDSDVTNVGDSWNDRISSFRVF